MKGTKTRRNKRNVNRSSEPFFSGKNRIQAKEDVSFFQTKESSSTSQHDQESDHFSTLRYGAQGEEVRYLQKRLNMHGATLVVDGVFGDKTDRAVRNFQAIHAPPIDGIVGPITWRALTLAVPQQKTQTLSNDYLSLAKSMYAINADVAKQSPTTINPLGNTIQTIGDKFAAISTQKTLIPTETSDSSDLVLPMTVQLDFLLKVIAITIGFGEFGKVNSDELLLYRKALVLHIIGENIEKIPGLHSLSQMEVDLFLKRVHLMRDFYNSFLSNGNFSSHPEMGKQHPITGPHSSERRRLIAYALSDVGKVRAQENPRFGWKHLKQIYDVSFNGKHPYQEYHFKKYSTTKQCAHGDSLCTSTKMKQHKDPLVNRDILGSWCGIGAMYWLKSGGGQVDLEWKSGTSGLANILEQRSFQELPKVGDVLISSKLDHHGLITWIDPKAKPPKTESEWKQISVKTVEANAKGGKIIHGPSGHETLGYFDRGAFNSFKRKTKSK